VEGSVGARFVAAIAAQDEAALARCFAPDARLRALVPRGLREREGAVEASALVAGWFADATELDLVESSESEVVDRLHVAYRFDVVEEGDPYSVEQQLYCTVEDGLIASVDLVCSGFRPRPRR
jgi:ketosteroid isomerase-like protein